MSIEEYEAAALILPVSNSNRRKALWVGIAGPNPQAVCIPSMFGGHAKHYYTIQADGAKVYVHLSSSPSLVPSGAVNNLAIGTPTTAVWAIPDGQQEHGFLLGGLPPPGSGFVPSGFEALNTVVFFTGTGSSSTGFIRIRRSSVGPNHGQEEFLAPGWAANGLQR